MKFVGSNLYSIPGVVDAMSWAKTILDIGAGSGKYGMLAHEYCRDLEYIDAIEPNKECFNEEWYRNFYIEKAEYVKLYDEYDVGLLTAVMGKLTNEQLAKILFLPCVKFVVTVEKVAHGNDRQWTKEELEKFFPDYKIKDLPSEWLIM